MSGQSARITPLHVLGTAAALVALLPLAYLLIRSSGAGWQTIWDILVQDRTAALAARSLGMAGAVAGSCALVGIPLAWVITRTDVPGGRWWLIVAALPLAIPSLVTAFAWVATIPSLQGAIPTWFILSLSCLPYVVLPVAAVLSRIDPGLEDVARTLGSGPATALPSSGRSPARSGCRCWRTARRPLRPQRLRRRVDPAFRLLHARHLHLVPSVLRPDDGPRSWLSSSFCSRSSSSSSSSECGGGTGTGGWAPESPGPQSGSPLGGRRWAAFGLLMAIYGLAVAFPAVVLVRLIAQGQRGWDPLEWLAATGNTVRASAIGALIAMGLALPIGMLAARYRDRWARGVESAAFLGHALPGVLVGLSLVYLGISLAPGLYQTLAMLGFAYAVLFLSNAIGSVRSAAAHVPPVLEDVGRTLGSSALTNWMRVTAPLAAPGIAAGALLVLVTAMKELPATLMLRPTGMDTLATELWTRTSVGAFAEAAPYALTLVLVAAVPAFLLARIVGRHDLG